MRLAAAYTGRMSTLGRAVALPSNSQLTALLDRSDEAMLLFDGQQRLAFANLAARRRFAVELGQRRSDALRGLGQTDAQRLRQALDAQGESTLDVALADGSAWRVNVTTVAGNARLAIFKPVQAPPEPIAGPDVASAVVHLLWDSPQPLVVQDAGFRVVAANRAFCKLVQRPVDEVTGADLHTLLAPDDAAAAAFERDEAIAALHGQRQPAHQIERRLTDRLGRERWLRSAPRWLEGADGAPLLLEVMQDVTLERAARAEAERSGGELAQWFDLSPIGMLVYDRSGLVVRCNAAFENLVGRAPVMLGDAPADLQRLLAWDRDAPHPQLRPDAPPLEMHATLALPDGRAVQLRSRLRALGAGGGRVMAVVQDRSLEDEHDLARLEIGALMDTAGVGVATFEASRGWLHSRAGRGGAGATALHPSLQSIGRDQVEPASQADFARLQTALREGRRAQVRYAVRVPGLGVRWLLTRVEPGELTGGRPALSVVTLDVTEQEEAHRRNEQLLLELSTILEGTSAGIAHLRGERLLRCNRRFADMLALAPESTQASLQEAFGALPEVLALLRRALAEPGRFELELQPRAGLAGDGAWYALSATHALADGEVEVVAVLTDISRLKAQQAELEALARERELMFSLSEVGIAHVRAGQIERANAAFARLSGYAADELRRVALDALVEPGADADPRWRETPPAAEAGASRECRLRRRDGSRIWVQVSERPVDSQRPDAGLICSYVDIDERRRVREALQLQAERTRAILDSVLVGIVTVGERGIEWMNRSARRMFGGELADFVGEPIATIAPDEPGHPLRATHYLDALADGQAETFECRLRGRDGREFWVVGNAVVTGRESTGSQITFALLDIERRRQAEVSIAQARASLQRIIETAPLAIALFDATSARLLRLNQMAAAFFGRDAQALLERTPEQWSDPEHAAALRHDLALALERGDVLRRELTRPPGWAGAADARVWDLRIVSLDAGGQTQLLLVGSDVTEQRAAEQARFDAAVSQRELLIKEVHHRIKNNLQGVAGLLQQSAARRPEVAALIGEAVGQVQAIAQVHGLQVGLAGPLRIEPLLHAITASVQRTFGRSIELRIECAALHRCALPEAESIPIALTINELLTNAIKHGTAGPIVCTLGCDDSQVTVAIRNPGRLREGFSLGQVPPGVSGLGLVRALLPRRSASLKLEADGDAVLARVVLVPPSVTVLDPQ